MKIGELAKRTGCLVETIRYYERSGLLPAPARTEGNYRMYGKEHIELLAFIRHCRSLDMSLEDIRRLLAFRTDPQTYCSDVNRLLDQHIEQVGQRIAELEVLQTQLRKLRARCRKEVRACGVLTALSNSGS